MSGDNAPLNTDLAHRHFAADCFNRAWTFIENPHRSAEDEEQMILLALASLWHWTQRADCTDQHRSIGHWQVSRVYALAGQGDNAMRHARRCLHFSRGLTPFYLAYAHEAVARAALLLGDQAQFKAHLTEARALADAVTDAEEKQLLLPDLTSLASQV